MSMSDCVPTTAWLRMSIKKIGQHVELFKRWQVHTSAHRFIGFAQLYESGTGGKRVGQIGAADTVSEWGLGGFNTLHAANAR